MARIRTVKPELWTDPEFTECSLSARLLLIAMFNFATDYGVLPDKPRQLKMQCLPADTVDVEPLIDELIQQRFLIRTVAPNGDKVLVIRTFTKNQKISRATLGRWGDPSTWPRTRGVLTEDSLSTRGAPPLGRDTDNSEGKGRESSESSETAPVDNSGGTDDDFHAAIELIVDAKLRDRPGISHPQAYRTRTRTNTITEEGELVRRMLADGTPPAEVAHFVLGHGLGSEKAAAAAPIAWCGPDCPECDGDAWIRTSEGLAPCPRRTA